VARAEADELTQRAQGAVVIGGGVVGLAAAWHLLRLGCRPVTVLERFRIGHGRGGSHGSARMTRSTYASAAYARLMRHVRDEEWPRLERAAGVTLVHPTDVVFFGPDRATLGGYAAAVQAAGADVDRVPVGEARRRFPALRFTDDAEILHDRSGGVIASAEAVRALHRLVESSGGVVREDTRVVEIDRAATAIRIVSDRDVLEAERVVIATGAWLPDLVPVARGAVTVVPQTVAYFSLGVPARLVPSWLHFGGAEEGITYGLTDVGRAVLKVGRHVTRGPGADPDQVAAPTSEDVQALHAALARLMTVPVKALLASEPCLYTMTATEEFVIDHWPGDPRVAFAAACSGHGFKFAPLTGRVLAELVVNGRAELPGGLDTATLFGRRLAIYDRAGS
jgi:monomeric sarcosine oxidase